MGFLSLLEPLIELAKAATAYYWRKRLPKKLYGVFQRVTLANCDEQATRMAVLGSLARPEVDALIQCLDNEGAALLVGEGGSGKTGIIAMLVRRLLEREHPVLLLRADGFPRSANAMTTIDGVLPLEASILDALRIVAEGKGASTLIIDQLDSVSGTDLSRLLCALLNNARALPGVMVVGVSRSYDAEKREEIRNLQFTQIESNPLTEAQATAYLSQLGVASPARILVELAQNLLNLSLIAELVEAHIDVTQVSGEIELWNLYRETVAKREGENALQQAVTIARETLQSGQWEFALPISPDNATRRLLSCGILIKSRGERYRFRHEQIQDYLYAWDAAMRRQILPDQVLQEVPETSARSVLRWMHLMYHRGMPEMEITFVRRLLGV